MTTGWNALAFSGSATDVLRGDGTFGPAPSGSQWTTTGSDVYYNSGGVGIGTATPFASAQLSVVSSRDRTIRADNTATTGTSAALFGTSVNTTNNSAAVRGEAQANSGQTYGIYGLNNSTNATAAAVAGETATAGYGVFGFNTSSTGKGVYGRHSGTGTGIGVWGITTSDAMNTSGVKGETANGSTNPTYGVWGTTTSSSIGGAGVRGESNSAGIGVFGINSSNLALSSGVRADNYGENASGVYGLHGLVTSTAASSAAVYGENPNAGYAGRFDGRLAAGSAQQFQVAADGNLNRVRNVNYVWPNATGSGVLTNDGAGNLSWASVPAGSQWTTSGSDIFFNTGNVGIGTSTPAVALELSKDFASNNTVQTLLSLTRTTTGTAANGIGTGLNFRLENNAGTVINAAEINSSLAAVTSGTESSDITFRVRNAGVMESRMFISGTGQVGVESDPSTNRPNFSVGRVTATAGTESASLTLRGNGIRHSGFSYVPGATAATSRLNISMGLNANPGNNAPLFTFQGDGNMGIGTTTPTSRLHVSGSTTSALSYFFNSGTGIGVEVINFGGGQAITATATTTSNTITSTNSGTGSAIHGVNGSSGRALFTFSSGAVTTAVTNTFLEDLRTNAGGNTTKTGLNVDLSGSFNGTVRGINVSITGGSTANYAALFNGGNVGIGTITPAQPLHVVGTARISGVAATGASALVVSNNTGDLARVDYSGNATDVFRGNGTWGPVAGDNLGNHTLGQNLVLSNYVISNNGSANGLRMNDNGQASFNFAPSNSNSLQVYRTNNLFGANTANIYAYRDGTNVAANGGTGLAENQIDAAIKGYSYWGNNFTAGVAGYSYLDYSNSSGVIGSAADASVYAALAHRDASSNLWALYASGNAAILGQLKQLTNPTDPQDAATKSYVDAQVGSAIQNQTAVAQAASFRISGDASLDRLALGEGASSMPASNAKLAVFSTNSLGYNNGNIVSYTRTNDGGAAIGGHAKQMPDADFSSGHWATGLLGGFEDLPTTPGTDPGDIGVLGYTGYGLNSWGGFFAITPGNLGSGQLNLAAADKYVGLAGMSHAAVFVGGNVGIGTDNPAQPLHVVGIARITNTAAAGAGAIVVSNNLGDLGRINYSGNVGDVFRGDASWGPAIGTVPNGTVVDQTLRWNNTAWVANSALRTNGSTVGIGAAPSANNMLWVNDNRLSNSFPAMRIEATSTPNTVNDGLEIVAGNASSSNTGLNISAVSPAGATSTGLILSATGGAVNRALLVNLGGVRINPLASGTNGAFITSDVNGDLARTNFTGLSTDVLRGDGTFGAAPSNVPNGTITNQTLRWSGAAWQTTGPLSQTTTAVGIGTTTPIHALDIRTDFPVANVVAYNTGTGTGGILRLGHVLSAVTTANTAVTNTAQLGSIEFTGGNGTTNAVGSSIFAQATENWTSTANGTMLSFSTTPNGSSTGALRMVINDQGNIGMGTTFPGIPLDIVRTNLYTESGLTTYSSTIHHPVLLMQRARGTATTPAATQAGDILGANLYRAHTGSAWETTRQPGIEVVSTQNWSATTGGSEMLFSVVPNNATNKEVVLRIDQNRRSYFMNNDIMFRQNGDLNHGVGYYGTGKLYNGTENIDGPVLYGYNGGGLGWEDNGSAARNIVLRWNNLNNVSIGLLTSNAKLHVFNNATDPVQNVLIASNDNNTAGANGILVSTANGLGTTNIADFNSAGTNRMRITANGRVGIAQTNPLYPLDIGASINAGTINSLYIQSANADVTIPTSNSTTVSVSVRATGAFWSTGVGTAGGFYASSDARIKRIVGVSDAMEDLATLMKLEVTDYRFVDSLSNGQARVKGVIAQQVKAVYPQAVSTQTNVIPDIYALAQSVSHDAQAKTLSLTMAKDTPLKAGDRLRLITAEGTQVDKTVTAASGNRFTVGEWAEATTGVFVYGREVNDFHIVDYDRLHTLSISAVQELARRNAALTQEVQELKAALDRNDTDKSTLQQQLQQVLGRLDAVEAQLGLKASTAK